MPKTEEPKNEQPKTEEVKKDQVINTEALKAKTAEVAGNVKEGTKNFVEKVKGDKTLMIICCAVAAVVVVLFLGLIIGGTGGSKGVAKKYARAYVKMDEKKICKMLHKKVLEERFDGELSDCYDSLEKTFDYLKDNDVKYTKYEITSKKVYDKDDVVDFADKIEDAYDIPAKKVKKVVRYKVKFDAKGKENDQKTEIYVVKIGGKWYVMG